MAITEYLKDNNGEYLPITSIDSLYYNSNMNQPPTNYYNYSKLMLIASIELPLPASSTWTTFKISGVKYAYEDCIDDNGCFIDTDLAKSDLEAGVYEIYFRFVAENLDGTHQPRNIYIGACVNDQYNTSEPGDLGFWTSQVFDRCAGCYKTLALLTKNSKLSFRMYYSMISNIEEQFPIGNVDITIIRLPQSCLNKGYRVGDVDGNNVINQSDLTILNSYFAGEYINDYALKRSDVNGDGYINTSDLNAISNYINNGTQSGNINKIKTFGSTDSVAGTTPIKYILNSNGEQISPITTLDSIYFNGSSGNSEIKTLKQVGQDTVSVVCSAYAEQIEFHDPTVSQQISRKCYWHKLIKYNIY